MRTDRESNQPPADADPLRERLDEDHRAILERRAELLGAAERLPDHLDAVQARKVTDLCRQIRSCIQTFDEIHQTEKAEFLEMGRKVDGWWHDQVDDLGELAERANALVAEYLDRSGEPRITTGLGGTASLQRPVEIEIANKADALSRLADFIDDATVEKAARAWMRKHYPPKQLRSALERSRSPADDPAVQLLRGIRFTLAKKANIR